MKLRPYQQKWLRRVLRAQGRVLVVGPTGAGKTVVAAALIRNARRQGKRVLFLAHRRDLVNQCVTRLHAVGVKRVGVIMAGCPSDPDADVQVASIQTYARRDAQAFDVIIIDEAHHATAKSYRKVIDDNQDAQLYGLTATPIRLDGKPLNDLFDSVAQSEFAPALIEQGALAKVRVWSHPAPDLSGVKRVGGDYDRGELGRRMKHKSIGDVVEHWELRAERRPAVCFAVNVEHAKRVVAEFRKRGYSAGLVVADTPIDERSRVISGLSTGETNAVVTVEVLTEGWDCPDAACCIMLRPTLSEALCRQMMGRAMRPTSKWPHSVILDHVGNTIRRVRILPDEARDWSDALDPKKPRGPGGEARTKECPDCGNSAWFGARTCGFCDHVFWVHEPPIEVSGWLEELTRDVRAEAVEMVREGISLRDVAKRFKVSRKRIAEWCNVSDVPLNQPKRVSFNVKQKALGMVLNGISYAETATDLGVSVFAVRKWCKSAGVKSATVNGVPKPEDVRSNAIRLVESGLSFSEAARRSGVSYATVGKWWKQTHGTSERPLSRQRKRSLEEALSLIGKGESAVSAARSTGACRHAISKAMAQSGGALRGNLLGRDVYSKALDLVATGSSPTHTAKVLGISHKAIIDCCKRAGFTRAGRGRWTKWFPPVDWNAAA